ncbi:unnamed protein product, partial [Cyprideis torosa]
MELSGKVAVITAAAQGIGRATALKFAEAGALVYATDINEELVRDLQGHHGAGEIRSSKLDVRDL